MEATDARRRADGSCMADGDDEEMEAGFGPVRPRGLPKEAADTVVQVWRRSRGGESEASHFPAAWIINMLKIHSKENIVTYHCSRPSAKAKTVDLNMLCIRKNMTRSMFFACPIPLDLVCCCSSSMLIRSKGINTRDMSSKLKFLRVVFECSSCCNSLIEYLVFSHWYRWRKYTHDDGFWSPASDQDQI